MKSERTNRRDDRPATPAKKVRESDQAAGEAIRDLALADDRLTKSGRLNIADVHRSDKKRR